MAKTYFEKINSQAKKKSDPRAGQIIIHNGKEKVIVDTFGKRVQAIGRRENGNLMKFERFGFDRTAIEQTKTTTDDKELFHQAMFEVMTNAHCYNFDYDWHVYKQKDNEKVYRTFEHMDPSSVVDPFDISEEKILRFWGVLAKSEMKKYWYDKEKYAELAEFSHLNNKLLSENERRKTNVRQK